MRPSKEYLDLIANKLDAMKALDGTPTDTNINRKTDSSGLPSLMDQMGITAQKYLDDQKKKQNNQ